MMSTMISSIFNHEQESKFKEERIATLVRYERNDLLKAPYIDTKKYTPEEIEEAKRRYAEIKKIEAANSPSLMDSVSSMFFGTQPKIVKQPRAKKEDAHDNACECRLF